MRERTNGVLPRLATTGAVKAPVAMVSASMLPQKDNDNAITSSAAYRIGLVRNHALISILMPVSLHLSISPS
jgi:hypothetical protein